MYNYLSGSVKCICMSIFTKILHNLRTCTCKIGGRGKKKKGYLNFASQKKIVFEAIRRCCFRICNYTRNCIPTTFAPPSWLQLGKWSEGLLCVTTYIWVELSLCCRLYRWLRVRRYNRWNTPHIADSPRKMGADQNIHVGDSYFFKFLNLLI